VRNIVGRPLAMLYTVEDRAAGRPEAELTSARDTGFYEVDGWCARADGSRFWAHTAYTAVYDHHGGLRGLVAIVRDLSERKRMRELEDEGQRMHRFIALLSHELRNPLAPITNAVRILERSQEPRDIAWCAHLIGRQAAHLTRLVDDLLDVSRITTGKIQIHLAPLELSTLLRLAFEAARAAPDAEGHEMTLRLPQESVFVNGDATRLTQVVANLLTNALRYTTPPGRIDVTLERLGHIATLQVADTGIGMSETLMARAFDPFVQGDAPLERRNAGLGIGLTLVKHVVERHGGTVAVASPGPGRGSRFTVSLPLLQQPAPAPAPLPAASVGTEDLRASSPASPR
jgi:signal transduction histidine kinase